MLAQNYYDIYLLVCSILIFAVMSSYSQRVLTIPRKYSTSYFLPSLIFAVIVIFYIGLRPFSGVFIDMMNYVDSYNVIFASQFYFDFDAQNLIFDNWIRYMASCAIPIKLVFLVIAVVYFGCIFISCCKLFPRDTFLAFLCYLVAFSTFTYATNGIKAGMAASFFLLALAYHEKIWISITLALITYGLHHSMSLVIAAYIIVLLIRNPKFYFFLWCISFLIAAFHITYFQHLFAGFTDEHGASYLLSRRNSGFRIDFIIYSAVPIFVGYYMIIKRKVSSSRYNLLLNIYVLTNSIWMLCMYSNFTNRIAYLSWFLYPIVLLYPFVNVTWSSRQSLYLKYCVYGHLAFTLFMKYIYY